MAKSVSSAVKELVKLMLVATGLGKTILAIVIGIKMLVQSVTEAISAFVRWVVSIGLTIGLFVVLGKVLTELPGKIDPVIIKLNEFGATAVKVLNDVYIGVNNLIGRVAGAIFAFEAWVVAGGPLAQMLVSICNFLNKDLSASLEKIITRLAVAIYSFDAWLLAGSPLAQMLIGLCNFLNKDLSDSLANMIAMIRDAILGFNEWLGSSANLAVLLQGISKFLNSDFSSALQNVQNLIDDLTGAVEDFAKTIEPLMDFLADADNGGIWDGGFDIIGPAPEYVKIITMTSDLYGKSASELSGISSIGLGSGLGSKTSNTTNITYNVRTTKDMSLRNAERERRLYNR